MPKIHYSRVIEEDSKELKELEKYHRYYTHHFFQRVRMLRLLRSEECHNLAQAARELVTPEAFEDLEEAMKRGR